MSRTSGGTPCRWIPIGLLVAAAGIVGSEGLRAATPAPIPHVVEIYAAALDRLPRAGALAPVESLYTLGMRAAAALPRVLEGLDDTTYAEVQRRMRGFVVEREEIVGAWPDLDFFASLARSRGGEADTAYFHALRSTRQPGGVFPSYVEQQTDYSGCTSFGSGRLADAFGVWKDFVTRYPHRYAAWAREELSRIEDELTTSTCACRDSASVLKELDRFVKAFPGAPVTPRVRERRESVRTGTAGIRYHCISG